MENTLDESDWETLIYRIKKKTCTPFIGAGASAEILGSGSKIARNWAEKYKYPFKDTGDLARVSQFLSLTTNDTMRPKELIQEQFQEKGVPNYSEPDEPHALLADLELPIYITTNYDNFMFEALEERRQRNPSLEPCTPQREHCCWNKIIEEEMTSVFGKEGEKTDYGPSVEKPLVYHLHGHYETPQSMVLTEDDYLDFLVKLSRDTQIVIPPSVRTAISKTSLLFIGYSLSDWNFRVLFRTLVGSEATVHSYPSIAVQLPPSDLADDSDVGRKRAQEYLQKYFGTIQKNQVKVYWGEARKFTADLRQRWEKSKNDPK